MKADYQPRRDLPVWQELALWAMAGGVIAVNVAWWGTVVYLLAVAQ